MKGNAALGYRAPCPPPPPPFGNEKMCTLFGCVCPFCVCAPFIYKMRAHAPVTHYAPTSGKPNLPTYIKVKWGTDISSGEPCMCLKTSGGPKN